MLEDLEYVGTFSSGVVQPGLMTADVTTQVEKNRPPLDPLLGKERNERTAHTICG
jgi:hypothetical protein